MVHHQAILDIPDSEGWTPLMFAAYKGFFDVAYLLVEGKCDPLARNNHGLTAHELALIKNLDPNMTQLIGSYSMFYAMEKNDIEHLMYHVRLTKGPNAKNTNGWTPAIFLASIGAHEQLDELIHYGADLNFAENDGWTALLFAVQNDHPKVVHVLLRNNVNVNAPEKEGWTALMFAAFNNNQGIVNMLLEAGANPLIKNHQGLSAYDIAVDQGHLQLSTLLADISALYAMEARDLDALMHYVKLGVNSNLANKVGWTPLMVAALEGSVSATEELLARDADVNMFEREGWTALLFAIQHQNPQVVELLLKAGARVDHHAKNGASAYALALQAKNPFTINLLVQVGVQFPDSIMSNLNGMIAEAEAREAEIAQKRQAEFEAREAELKQQETEMKAPESQETHEAHETPEKLADQTESTSIESQETHTETHKTEVEEPKVSHSEHAEEVKTEKKSTKGSFSFWN